MQFLHGLPRGAQRPGQHRSPGSIAAAPLQPRPLAQRLPEQPSHDWRPVTTAIPAAGGSIAFHGEDSRGWDFKVRKALEHAKSLGLIPLPLDPLAPADLLVVESKAFLQAQRSNAVEGKRWGAL